VEPEEAKAIPQDDLKDQELFNQGIIQKDIELQISQTTKSNQISPNLVGDKGMGLEVQAIGG
jgi:hypothetical protein